jgi:hypothetical protein
MKRFLKIGEVGHPALPGVFIRLRRLFSPYLKAKGFASQQSDNNKEGQAIVPISGGE